MSELLVLTPGLSDEDAHEVASRPCHPWPRSGGVR